VSSLYPADRRRGTWSELAGVPPRWPVVSRPSRDIYRFASSFRRRKRRRPQLAAALGENSPGRRASERAARTSQRGARGEGRERRTSDARRILIQRSTAELMCGARRRRHDCNERTPLTTARTSRRRRERPTPGTTGRPRRPAGERGTETEWSVMNIMSSWTSAGRPSSLASALCCRDRRSSDLGRRPVHRRDGASRRCI